MLTLYLLLEAMLELRQHGTSLMAFMGPIRKASPGTRTGEELQACSLSKNFTASSQISNSFYFSSPISSLT